MSHQSLDNFQEQKHAEMNKKAPYWLLFFVATFILLDVIFAYTAHQLYEGQVTPTPYHKGLDYNEVIAQGKEQEALKLHEGMKFEADQLEFCLHDERGQPLVLEDAMLSIQHPVTNKFDFTIPLKVNDRSCHYTTYHTLAKGQWEVLIRGNINNFKYFFRKRQKIGID